MASTDNTGKAPGGPGAAKANGFRLRYIAERLKELNAERERLIEERKVLQAQRGTAAKDD